MQNNHGKFQQKKSGYMPAKRGSHLPDIPYITLYYIFYESIKNLQFLIINLYFPLKLLLA